MDVSIGPRIAETRMRVGLSVEELASRADVDAITLATLEEGNAVAVSTAAVARLARALEVDLSDWLEALPAARVREEIDLAVPIFRTDGLAEIDESHVQGSNIGGMAAAHADAGLAAGYMRAADLLVERCIDDACAHQVAMPILFLYRHAIELRLKFAAQPVKLNHDLATLARELNGLLVC